MPGIIFCSSEHMYTSRLTVEQVEVLRAFWGQVGDDLPKVDRVALYSKLRDVQGAFVKRTDTSRAAGLLREFCKILPGTWAVCVCSKDKCLIMG